MGIVDQIQHQQDVIVVLEGRYNRANQQLIEAELEIVGLKRRVAQLEQELEKHADRPTEEGVIDEDVGPSRRKNLK